MHKNFLITWSRLEDNAYNFVNIERKPTGLGAEHTENKLDKAI